MFGLQCFCERRGGSFCRVLVLRRVASLWHFVSISGQATDCAFLCQPSDWRWDPHAFSTIQLSHSTNVSLPGVDGEGVATGRASRVHVYKKPCSMVVCEADGVARQSVTFDVSINMGDTVCNCKHIFCKRFFAGTHVAASSTTRGCRLLLTVAAQPYLHLL